MKYKKGKSEIKVKNGKKNIRAKLICSENQRNLISGYNVAFINKGKHDSIRKGQIYSIFKKQGSEISQVSKKKLLLAPLKIGRLIVLRTEKTASTVLILSAQKTVRAGYLIH